MYGQQANIAAPYVVFVDDNICGAYNLIWRHIATRRVLNLPHPVCVCLFAGGVLPSNEVFQISWWREVRRPQRTKTVNMIAFQPEPFLISVTWHWCIASRLSASSSVLLCCDISANVTGDRRQHWGDYSSPSIWLNKPMTNKLSPWPRYPTVSRPQADGLL